MPTPGGAVNDAEPDLILLVKDDQASRAALGLELRRAGLRPIETDNAMEALDVLDQAPDIALAIVSPNVPPKTLNGVSFACIMKRRNRKSRIVLVVCPSDDISELSEAETGLFEGIVVRVPDIPVMAADILRLLGVGGGAASGSARV